MIASSDSAGTFCFSHRPRRHRPLPPLPPPRPALPIETKQDKSAGA